jgi:zinc finger protein
VIEQIQQLLDRPSHSPKGLHSYDKNLDSMFEPSQRFTFIINDPAGNSYLENPFVPDIDPQMNRIYYNRTSTQDLALGLKSSRESIETEEYEDKSRLHKSERERTHSSAGSKKTCHVTDVSSLLC